MASMGKIAKIVYERCFKLKTKETVLIIADNKKSELGRFFFEEGKKIAETCFMEMQETKRNGSPPPKQVEAAMMVSDVILFVTEKSLSHTIARKRANSKGARIASLPGITKDMLQRCIDMNYPLMKKRSLALAKELDKGKNVRITTRLGTDITFSIAKRKSLPDFGDLSYKGAFDNLPSGETFIAPVEGTANGIYYVDICMGTGLLKKPIKITVKDGFAVLFEGMGNEVNKIKKMFDKLPKAAFNIAEFGVGTNDKAIETGNILEDEKIYGTCHLALGNNITFGGKTNVPMHLDGVIRKPTIYIDGKIIMKEGILLR